MKKQDIASYLLMVTLGSMLLAGCGCGGGAEDGPKVDVLKGDDAAKAAKVMRRPTVRDTTGGTGGAQNSGPTPD